MEFINTRKSEMVAWLTARKADRALIDWALEHCDNLDEVWDKAPAERVYWLMSRAGLLDRSTLRRAACHCARWGWDLLGNADRSIIQVAERHIAGMATDAELRVAYTSANRFLFSVSFVEASAILAAKGTAAVFARRAFTETFLEAQHVVSDAYERVAAWARKNAIPKW